MSPRVGLALLVVLCGLAIAWPALSMLPGFAPTVSANRADPLLTAAPDTFLGTWPLFGSSLAWAAIPAAIATVIGWPLGLALAARRERGGGRPLAVAMALPICLPGYLVVWSLWLATGPGTPLGDVVMRADLVPLARAATLAVSLVAWSMPFAAFTIAAWRSAVPDPAARLRALDGAGRAATLRGAVRHDGLALLRGWAIATLAIFSESVAFDLAQVRTYGYELRTLDATGAPASEIARLAWPSIVAVAALLALAVGVGRASARGGPRVRSEVRGGLTWWPLALATLVATPALLVVARSLSLRDADAFARLYLPAAFNSAAIAFVSAVTLAFVAISLVVVLEARTRWIRIAGAISAGMWLIAASTPATLVAVALESAYNRVHTAAIYDGPAIVVLGLVARLGAVAVLAASLARSVEPRPARLLRSLDGVRSWLGRWRVARPTLSAAGIVALLAGAGLGFSEIGVTARVRPPSVDVLATGTLNAIHYQQPETVIIGSALAVLVAAATAIVAVLVLFRARGALLAAAVVIAGCARPASDGPPPIPVVRAQGGPGFGPAQFHTPRAVAWSPSTRRYFVVDKEARVQRFDENGEYELEWQMPEQQNGKPVGIAVHPDGRVFVADTHYYRVLVYDQDGRELGRFGSYGKELGQFIYPTDIDFGPDGRIYVGEYNSNDRIQIFGPTFEPLAAFGSFGIGDGELSRPQTIAFDRLHGELFVADTNNHRIVVYDGDGNLLRQFGRAGSGPGELAYPRGIVLLGDGTILVGEFGNHRVQQLDARPGATFGASLGIWGGAGNGIGQLQYPWDLAGEPGHIAVLDSGRNRLLMTTLPKSDSQVRTARDDRPVNLTTPAVDASPTG